MLSKKIDTDNQYRQEKYGRIVAGIDITPNEVTDFYNMYKFELPEVKDEVRLARIMIYPKLKDSHKQEIIDKLKKIKKQIEGGESFEKMATIYSERPRLGFKRRTVQEYCKRPDGEEF